MDGSTTEVIATATVFAMVVTKTVDLIRNLVAEAVEDFMPKATWNFVSLGLGVAMALAWRINILDNYSSKNSVVQGLFGQVLTGFAIGGSSSGYHELFDVLSSAAKRAKYGERAGEVTDARRTRRPRCRE
jgi:hypothetical protein